MDHANANIHYISEYTFEREEDLSPSATVTGSVKK